MKFLHLADVHLGSKIEAKLPQDKTEERKSEIRAAFKNAIEYAAKAEIKVVVLAGDMFDSDRPFKKDKEFFYSVVRNNPNIDFLYLRGNHDVMESYVEEDLPNLKTFSKEWTSYDYGEIAFTGIEIAPENAVSMYSSLKLDENRINVVILHGQKGDTGGKDKVNLLKLKNKNIDYLALGHLHTYITGRLDERGIYAYPGCLEGRGFDETGEKGFVEVEISAIGKAKAVFRPTSIRKIEECEVDVSGAKDAYEAYKIVRQSVKGNDRDIFRIVLTGEIEFDGDGLKEETERLSEGNFYFVDVKDKTVRKIDPEKLVGDNTLKGEFIRRVLESDETEEKKSRIISIGLKALSDREID